MHKVGRRCLPNRTHQLIDFRIKGEQNDDKTQERGTGPAIPQRSTKHEKSRSMLHMHNITLGQALRQDDTSKFKAVVQCYVTGAQLPEPLLHWLIAIPLADEPVIDEETWNMLTSYALCKN